MNKKTRDMLIKAQYYIDKAIPLLESAEEARGEPIPDVGASFLARLEEIDNGMDEVLDNA